MLGVYSSIAFLYHSVVSCTHIPCSCSCLCFFHLEHFCPPTVFISYDLSFFVNKLLWHVTFNKLQTPVWEGTKIPGGECHRLRIQDTKLTNWFVYGQQNIEIGWWGCQQMCRWVSITLLHMHNVFPARRGKQMIMMSFSDIMNIMLMQRVGVYKESKHEPWDCHLGFWSWTFW